MKLKNLNQQNKYKYLKAYVPKCTGPNMAKNILGCHNLQEASYGSWPHTASLYIEHQDSL